jgi:hypothetical protein
LEKGILRELENCYEAYLYFPFNQRFNRFKEKKWYFLEGLSPDLIEKEYHLFVFFQYASFHKVYPKVSKKEIIEYYERRKSKV